MMRLINILALPCLRLADRKAGLPRRSLGEGGRKFSSKAIEIANESPPRDDDGRSSIFDAAAVGCAPKVWPL
jgi:hypothetical protein